MSNSWTKKAEHPISDAQLFEGKLSSVRRAVVRARRARLRTFTTGGRLTSPNRTGRRSDHTRAFLPKGNTCEHVSVVRHAPLPMGWTPGGPPVLIRTIVRAACARRVVVREVWAWRRGRVPSIRCNSLRYVQGVETTCGRRVVVREVCARIGPRFWRNP